MSTTKVESGVANLILSMTGVSISHLDCDSNIKFVFVCMPLLCMCVCSHSGHTIYLNVQWGDSMSSGCAQHRRFCFMPCACVHSTLCELIAYMLYYGAHNMCSRYGSTQANAKGRIIWDGCDEHCHSNDNIHTSHRCD